MKTITAKNLLLIIISGFLFSGCYTQLGSLEKDSEEVETDVSNIIDDDIQVDRYGYYDQNPFWAYDNFYYPYFLYSGGYLFGSYYSTYQYAPYYWYGYWYGHNDLPLIAGGVSRDNNQIRTSGLYSSGDRGERRTRGTNGSNSRSDLSNSNENSRLASSDTGKSSDREVRSRESSTEMLRSRSSAIRSNSTISEDGTGERLKRGAIQSRGRNFTYSTNNIGRQEGTRTSGQNTSFRTRSNAKSFTGRRTVNSDTHNRSRDFTASDLSYITRRSYSTSSNAEAARNANLSILTKSIRLVDSTPLTTRQGMLRSVTSGYFKNTSWYTKFENGSIRTRSEMLGRHDGVHRGHNVHTSSRSRSSSGINSGSSGRSSGSSVTRSRSSSNSRGSRSGSSSSGSRSSGSNNQRSSGSN